jgi:hypothetical protein
MTFMKTIISLTVAAMVFVSSLLPGNGVQAATPEEHGDEATFASIDFPDAISTDALDINAAGEIVGGYTTADSRIHGFLRSRHGDFTPIDVPGSNLTRAAGINRRGDIVGQYRLEGEDLARRHGFLLRRHRELLLRCGAMQVR